MSFAYSTQEKVAVQLAKDLESDGYSVIFTPSAEHFPFSLDGYTPDLLAIKGGKHLIIEIKTKDQYDSPKFRKIVDTIENHNGWKFLIKTLPDTPSSFEAVSNKLIDIEKIEDYTKRANMVISSGSPELSIPYFWNAVVSLLRLRAAQSGIPYAELTDRSLINHLYTMGLVSSGEYEHLLKWNQLRNEAVHNVPFQVDSESVEELSQYVNELIEKAKTRFVNE